MTTGVITNVPTAFETFGMFCFLEAEGDTAMRTMVVKSGQTLAEVSASLIDSRVNKAAVDAASKRIVALNPTLATGAS